MVLGMERGRVGKDIKLLYFQLMKARVAISGQNIRAKNAENHRSHLSTLFCSSMSVSNGVGTSFSCYIHTQLVRVLLLPSYLPTYIHTSMATVLGRLLRGRNRRFRSSYSASSSSSEVGVIPKKSTVSEGRNVQWVFLGCPGVGKGTYAGRLSKLLRVPHIATGDLVRHELSTKGPLSSQLSEIVNQGKLVSDQFIIDLLSKRLEDGEAKGESGFILDGFPRTLRQAEILEGVTNRDLVINLKLREEALLAKCLGRRTCSQCGGNYNVACIDIKADNEKPAMCMPPLLPPSHCASKLITRSDDTEEVIKERLRIYNEKSRPVEEFYRKRGKLLEFDLPGGISESWTKLLNVLNLDDHEDKRSAAV